MEACQGLTDGELVKSCGSSAIFKNYRIKEEIRRHAATVDFANRTESGLQDQGFLGQSSTYLRPINRILQNEFNDQRISNWGLADTYDHTRRIPQSVNRNGRNRGNGPASEFPIRNRPNQYVNFAVGDQDGNQDNREYNDEESDNPDYYGDRSGGKGILTENGDNSSPCELETGEIDGRHTESDV